MTENEAINVFKKPTKHITKLLLDEEEAICYSSDMVKAFETAIKALEEIQQYRAIGTIEELQELKNKMEQIHKIVMCEQQQTSCENTKIKSFAMIEKILYED